MSQVGSFPGLQGLNRRTVRGPVNPMDKSTIVSIFPKVVRVEKITLIPGRWEIPAGSAENPTIFVIGPSSWFKELEPHEPLLEIPQGSNVIAESIVNDYCNGIFGCDMGSSKPGIFWVPGEHNIESIRKNHSLLLQQAVAGQAGYYRTMLRAADQLWAVANGNPLVINEEMRMAAKYLGQEDKDWMKDHTNVGMTRCFACGSMKNPQYAVCATCNIIDPQHPQAGVVLAAQRSSEAERLKATINKVG